MSVCRRFPIFPIARFDSTLLTCSPIGAQDVLQAIFILVLQSVAPSVLLGTATLLVEFEFKAELEELLTLVAWL